MFKINNQKFCLNIIFIKKYNIILLIEKKTLYITLVF